MQVYPVLLLSFIYRLPESPRWFIFHDRNEDAHEALINIYGEDDAKEKLNELEQAHEEESSHGIGYNDMVWPSSEQYHQTVVTVMGQVNQALTGYGAVSVYGPQIFELLGFGVSESEYLTMGNYFSYFCLMTLAWVLIDRVGRRFLMVGGALGMSLSFLILTVLGGLASNSGQVGIPNLAVAIPGSVTLYVATGLFGIGWLSEPWLIPTEIYPSTSRAQGTAISVVIWGLANFAVTLLTPIGFNNLKYWLFLVFAATNLFAGGWTWVRQGLCFHGNLPLISAPRRTPRRRVADRSKTIRPSSRMPKKLTHGESRKSIRGSFYTCPKVNRKMMRMANRHLYWATARSMCC